MTLGIPRLRELLMTAAQSIKTPVMTLPLLPHCTRADAETLANRLRRLRLAEVISLSLLAWDSKPCHGNLSSIL